ncbi:hypothetical protein D3C73_1296320 [compost metagenome]
MASGFCASHLACAAFSAATYSARRPGINASSRLITRPRERSQFRYCVAGMPCAAPVRNCSVCSSIDTMSPTVSLTEALKYVASRGRAVDQKYCVYSDSVL